MNFMVFSHFNNPFFVLSVYYLNAVSLHSQCCQFTLSMLSVYYLNAVSLLSQCYRFTNIVLDSKACFDVF